MIKKNSGFTLIELLIVIAIIGILAVAFLPSLLGAPAKGRDSQRVAALQKIQGVLISSNAVGKQYPESGCIDENLKDSKGGLAFDISDFNGAMPVDPSSNELTAEGVKCTGKYVYIKGPADKKYSFGLYAKLETATAGNALCSEIAGAKTGDKLTKPTDADTDDSCYVVLLK